MHNVRKILYKETLRQKIQKHEGLKKLSLQLLHENEKTSAGGFFDINMTLIFSVSKILIIGTNKVAVCCFLDGSILLHIFNHWMAVSPL